MFSLNNVYGKYINIANINKYKMSLMG